MKAEQPQLAYRNPNPRYHADFADVAVTREGDLIMVARKCGQWAHDATFKFGRPLTFFEARAEILVLRSTDGGATFVVERLLHTGLAFDPMICALADGQLMAGTVVGEAGPHRNRAAMGGILHRHIPQLDTVVTVCGIALWFSEDHGRVWSQPQMVALPGWENVYNLRKPVQVADGTMLMPVATGYPTRSRFVGLLRSWDGGATWGDPSIVAEDPAGRAHLAAGFGYWQPALALRPTGDLVCVCPLDEGGMQRPGRTGEAPDLMKASASLPSLYVVRSRDSGFSWSQPRDTGLEGDFPSLITLPDGRLLLAYTQRQSRRSVIIAHVSDDGVIWGPPMVVREAADHLFYYVNTVILPDSTLVSVYMVTPPDQVRIVEAVRWRLSGS